MSSEILCRHVAIILPTPGVGNIMATQWQGRRVIDNVTAVIARFYSPSELCHRAEIRVLFYI